MIVKGERFLFFPLMLPFDVIGVGVSGTVHQAAENEGGLRKEVCTDTAEEGNGKKDQKGLVRVLKITLFEE